MILVIGGTGFIGSFLLLELIQTRKKIRAIFRTGESLESTRLFFEKKGRKDAFEAIEWLQVPELDCISLASAMQDVETVFHAAGKVSFDESQAKQLHKSNHILTREIVNAAIQARVSNFLYFGTIAVLNDTKKGGVINEETEWSPEVNSSAYAKSKWAAELEVWRGQEEGLRVAVLLPSVVLGWKDGTAPSESIFAYALGDKPLATSGGTGFVAVSDVAACARKIYDQEKYGQRFVLNGENLRYKDFLDSIRAKRGLVKTNLISPFKLFLIQIFGWMLPLLGKRKISVQQIKSWSTIRTYDSSKAEKELEHAFKPIQTTLTEILDEIPQ